MYRDLLKKYIAMYSIYSFKDYCEIAPHTEVALPPKHCEHQQTDTKLKPDTTSTLWKVPL